MLWFPNPILCTAPAGSSFHKLSGPAHKAGYLATDWLLNVSEMFYQSEVGCCNINTPVELHLAQRFQICRRSLNYFLPLTD